MRLIARRKLSQRQMRAILDAMAGALEYAGVPDADAEDAFALLGELLDDGPFGDAAVKQYVKIVDDLHFERIVEAWNSERQKTAA